MYVCTYIQFIVNKYNGKNACAFSVILSYIIYCGFPNHIRYVVLIKSNLQITLFVYEKGKKEKKVSDY